MKLNLHTLRTAFYVAWTFGVVLLGMASIRADDRLGKAAGPTPQYTVEEVMQAVFKGEDSTGKKISQGKGTPVDYDRLVQYLTALPLNDPPQGDAAGWKQKTATLLQAAIALKDGKPNALAQYNTAVNCQACHRIYRPD